MPSALITGGTRGLGRALATALAKRNWRVVVDGRSQAAIKSLVAEIDGEIVGVVGDVTDPFHRIALVEAVGARLDLLVNNASELGPSPLLPLHQIPSDAVTRIFEVNVHAPLALIQALLPSLAKASGVVVNLSSDAAVEAYDGWGAYGASKAALDQLSAVLAV
ncbi:MAG: SDR family oxidoreductase, partial [Acidimicrobiia bacterium]|nr:SDR family oxidoreductase [Acidimicrobiia bacterium]